MVTLKDYVRQHIESGDRILTKHDKPDLPFEWMWESDYLKYKKYRDSRKSLESSKDSKENG